MKYDDLKKLQNDLTHQIDQATNEENHELVIELKKKFYQNKLDMLDAISEEDRVRNAVTAAQLRDEVRNNPIPARYATGITILDEKLKGGFEVGTFVQLAGQSGGGKTTIVLSILANIADYSKCMMFNFEMGSRRIVDRLGKLLHSDHQWENLLVDSLTRGIDDLCNEITLSARDGIKFFMIDSMMKIETGEQDDLKAQAIISKKLAKVSQEREVIVILINQMSEDAIRHKRLSLKGSNSQQYDADMSFFLIVEDNKRRLICSKNRQDEYLFNLDIGLGDLKAPQEVEVTYQSIEMQKAI